MAKNETIRIRPSLLQQDRDGFAALKNIGSYKPANDDFTIANVKAAQDAMVGQRDIEAQKQADLDAARDDATAAEWAFHNAVLGAKDQVKAQFGVDSNELQAVGLKKKSEYKSPQSKKELATATA
jgi:hypothetical protein